MANYLDKDGVLYLWGKVKALFNKGITGLSVNGKIITYTKGDGTTGTITTQDTNTTYDVVSKTNNGLAPKLPNETTTTKYLRQDGSWAVPPNTTYSLPTASASTLGGVKVGANLSISNGVLSANDTTYEIVNGISDGLCPKIPSTSASSCLLLQASVDINETVVLDWGEPELATGNHDGFMPSAMFSKLNEFQDASKYALKSDITNTYKYKGSVATASNLPTSGQTSGDVYNIVAESSYGPAGCNVAWNGSAWDSLGGVFTISSISNSDLDTICV